MKMKPSTHLSLCFAALLGVASVASTAVAQTPTPTMAPNGMLKHSDKTFMEKAAKSGMDEVAISTGALDRLTNPQVKDFANMMITDHTASNSALMALASTKGVTLPPKDKEVQDKTDKWSKKTKDVDADYLKQMVSDHEDAVKLFEKATKSDDADVAAFAQKTLPTLQHHLDMAKNLKMAVK